MSEVCGIIADLKREAQGVYEFRRLTLLGYDTDEPAIKQLVQLGYKISDANPGAEGVEITQSSPFQLMRTMAKELGFKACVPANSDAPSDRQTIVWTLISGEEAEETIGVVADIKRESEGEYVIPTCTVFGLNQNELDDLVGKGFKIGDANKKFEGIEISGSSPYKVMRILCRDYGWTTNGEIVQTPAPGDRTAAMWTLTRKV